MSFMNQRQKGVFLDHIGGLCLNLGRPLHSAIDTLFSHSFDADTMTLEQEVYTTHIFGCRLQDKSCFKTLRDACKKAAMDLADSDGKLVDVIQYERAIDTAIDTFVASSLFDGKQISKAFFETQKLKEDMLYGVTSIQDFFTRATKALNQTCDGIQEKIGPKYGYSIAKLKLHIQKALEDCIKNNATLEAVEIFEQTFIKAVDETAAECKIQLEPELVDYLKAAGLTLLGVLLGLILFPLTVFSGSYQNWLGSTFFSSVSGKTDLTAAKIVRADMSVESVLDLIDGGAISTTIQP